MSYGYNTTGRTASTSSIYDYPEHLNPFYEDENHKRIRFWKFGNQRSDTLRSERRGSLVSIRDGLRDMWEFKTFRLKKKRSSSLGINKTSESPPPLRREDADSHYNTISNGSAYRNTVNTMGYGSGYSQSTTTTPLFERGSRYRSSMQDQSKQENGIGLHRNDRYRSTIQNGFATYSGSVVTSTHRSRYNATGTTRRGMTAGVSQSSLKSSNPFDDGDMDDSVSLSDSIANGTLRQSMMRQRKKRRAPPPPPPVRNLANTSVESTDTVLATRLKIDESPPPEDPEDVKNLTNLTAEIESFVRTSSDDKVNQTTIEQTNQSENLASLNDSNNNHVTEQLVIVERKEEIVEKVNATRTDVIEQDLSKVDGSIKPTVLPSTSNVNIPEPVEQISRIEELRIEETESNAKPSSRSKSSPPPIPQTPPVVEAEDMEGIALPETPVPARRHNKNRSQIRQTNGTALRITESSDSATASTTEEEENMESKAIKPINYEFQYKVEPIKTKIDEKIGTARLKISESTGDINSIQNAGTERRRSVRDIIESINKSQSLLKVNHETTGTLHSAQSNDSVNRNMRELNEREREIQRMLQEMEATFSNAPPEPSQMSSVPPPTNKRGSYYDNVPEGDENLDNLDDRNNLLSKSALRSKKSPTKSLGIEQPDDVQFQDCIDWNPLPKPRRSRHFPDSTSNQSTSAVGGVLTVIDQNNNGNTNQS